MPRLAVRVTLHAEIPITSYTSLFSQDMIQDIYILHWNIIHKVIGVA